MVDWTSQIPHFLHSMMSLALAIILLRFASRQPAARVFAWLIMLRAVAATSYSLGLVADGSAATFWWTLRPIPFFFLPFAALHFILVYPRQRGKLGRSPLTGRLLFAAGAFLAALYLWRQDLFWTLEGYEGNGYGPEVDAPAGPLFVFDVLFEAVYGLAALFFALDYLRAPAGPRRTSLLLVSLGFATVVLLDSLLLPLVTPDLFWRHAQPLALQMFVSLMTGLALVLTTVMILVRALVRSGDENERRHIRRYLLVLTFPVISILLLLILPSLALPFTRQGLFYLFGGAWRLALPLFVAYALLRHRFFGIDLTIKWTLRRGTVAIVMLAIVVGATEAAVNFVSSLSNLPVGLAVGAAIAASAFLLFRPIQRLAERASDAAMPHVQETDSYRNYRKFEVYRAAFETALENEDISSRERRVLSALRRELGITDVDADALERDVREKHARASLAPPQSASTDA